MDAGDVEYCEGDGRGRYGTSAFVIVAEGEDSTKVFQWYVFEMSPSPTLKRVKIMLNLEVDVEYLQEMEWFTAVRL